MLLLVTFLFSFKHLHAETLETQTPNHFQFLESLDAVVKGESLLEGETLHFDAIYHDDTPSLYVINLDLNNKKWSTHMTFLNGQPGSIHVKSTGVTLSDFERSHLSFAADKVNQSIGSDVKDTLAARLLIQIMTYWSQSPPNYKITDRKLGG